MSYGKWINWKPYCWSFDDFNDFKRWCYKSCRETEQMCIFQIPHERTEEELEYERKLREGAETDEAAEKEGTE